MFSIEDFVIFQQISSILSKSTSHLNESPTFHLLTVLHDMTSSIILGLIEGWTSLEEEEKDTIDQFHLQK